MIVFSIVQTNKAKKQKETNKKIKPTTYEEIKAAQKNNNNNVKSKYK